MVTLTEDVGKLFEQVLFEISQNVRMVMEELWVNWSHLGVDEKTKTSNIMRFVQIEREFHSDVITETSQKLIALQAQVDKLKEETEELSRCLSVDISILEYREDMMLIDYKKELEDQIAGYREQVEQRRTKMERLLEWQSDLADKLGVTIHELQEIPLPSEEELNKLKVHLEMLQAERDKRAEIFLKTQVEIKDIMDKLQIRPQNKFEHAVMTSLSVDFKVTDMNMDRLAKLQQDLQEKYEQTNNRVLELREKLAKLWDCLEEDQIYTDNFLQAHPGCNPQTESALKEEIKRCDQIKRQKISVFVANVRTKIKLMWDNIMYSSQEREEFVHYYQDIFSEDTLTLHELYLDKITKFYNDNKRLFELVVIRNNQWLKLKEMDARADDPNRFANRGGGLLKEERDRISIGNNLLKIEVKIRNFVTKYEETYGKVFTVDGKPLLQLIQNDWDNRKAARRNKVSASKLALTPTTPSFRSMAVSPLGKRDRTAAGLAHTVDRNRPPTKRQLLTGSAQKPPSRTPKPSPLKRSAATTIKRRVSGRRASRTDADGKLCNAKRILNYNGDNLPTLVVNGSILKRKRKSQVRRRSDRFSSNATGSTATTATCSTASGGRSEPVSESDGRSDPPTESGARSDLPTESDGRRDPLTESTLVTTYNEFKDGIHDRQVSRSSMACNVNEQGARANIPIKPPRNQPSTSRLGRENHLPVTPTNQIFTPTGRTRSAQNINHNGFATPRPSSSNRQRQNAAANLAVQTPNNVRRSRSHSNLIRAKNLPPII